jgi:hypothetical protein
MWVTVDVVVIAALMKDTEGCDHGPFWLADPAAPRGRAVLPRNQRTEIAERA